MLRFSGLARSALKQNRLSNCVRSSFYASSLLPSSSRISEGGSPSGFTWVSRRSSATARAPHASESFLSGTSSTALEELHESWKQDPSSVDASWDRFFSQVDAGAEAGRAIDIPVRRSKFATEGAASPDGNFAAADSLKVFLLIRAYRVLGHFLADLDPLNLESASFSKIKEEYKRELEPETYGFTEADMSREFFVGDELPGNKSVMTLREIIDLLRKVYCGKIGVQFMHAHSCQIKEWVKDRMERSASYTFSKEEKLEVLELLMKAEQFEDFLQKRFGAKRFGLDGGESLIPLMETLTEDACKSGVKNVVIGMPHRGRLSVMAHILSKPYAQLFNEFQMDKLHKNDGQFDETQGSGDVKYHLGTATVRNFPDGKDLHLSISANPSHLEAVNPVVNGKTRAKQTAPDGSIDFNKAMSVLIHGDAAFAGQGIVGECHELGGLKDFTTGGTIHIIVNNQIGFTTVPKYARTSAYPSEIAKVSGSPIFHCNGDDPESVVRTAKLAVEFRQLFNQDVVIDMYCYRRFGHNENDEPRFTQPKMYAKIAKHKKVSALYIERLMEEGVVDKAAVDELNQKIRQELQDGYDKRSEYVSRKADWLESRWTGFKSYEQLAKIKETGLSPQLFDEVVQALVTVPPEFNMHKNLKNRRFKEFAQMQASGTKFNWAMGEALAYGSLLAEGYGVRLCGQDCERGTFTHRHAVLYDQETEETYVPLRNIKKDQGHFQVINSNLSENAVLGFEHGYSLEDPNNLVLWEAQFGDFANGAQVIIDQFIASGEQKWHRMSGLTMLLPHGFEGQGPEHSSARLERFLQLVDDDPRKFVSKDEFMNFVQHINMVVAMPTTPANMFHLLRRQIHREFRKPLIVMTPKFLLGYAKCVSDKEEFLEDRRFKRVIKDQSTNLVSNDKVRKILFCSGKVYYDLDSRREELRKDAGGDAQDDVAIVRLEQLAPFPHDLVAEELAKYPNAQVSWVQEEPLNQGSWSYVSQRFETTMAHADRSERVRYIGRNPSAAPATGFKAVHLQELGHILEESFD